MRGAFYGSCIGEPVEAVVLSAQRSNFRSYVFYGAPVIIVVTEDKVDRFLEDFVYSYQISLDVAGLTDVAAYPDSIEIQFLEGGKIV